MVNAYDTLVIGPVSLGQNIDWLGVERRKAGGAQQQTGCPPARSPATAATVTMASGSRSQPARPCSRFFYMKRRYTYFSKNERGHSNQSPELLQKSF